MVTFLSLCAHAGPAPAAAPSEWLEEQAPGSYRPTAPDGFQIFEVSDFPDQSLEWDIDGIRVEHIAPEFLTQMRLARFWTLADRPESFAKDSPGSMRITSDPLQVYVVRRPENRTPLENQPDELAAIQAAICAELEFQAPTKLFLSPAGLPGIPARRPRRAHRRQDIRLPKQLKLLGGRKIEASVLSQALATVIGLTIFEGYMLSAAGFGWKADPELCGLYNNTVAAMAGCCPLSYIDLAVELGKDEGHSPWVCKPSGVFLDMARSADFDEYPMFPGGAVDTAAGGITFKNVVPAPHCMTPQRLAPQANAIVKLKVYSIWAHHLQDLNEACRLPEIVGCKDGLVTVSPGFFNSHLAGILKLYRAIKRPRYAGGMRFEFRISLADLEPTWATQLPKLLEYLASALLSVQIGKIRLEANQKQTSKQTSKQTNKQTKKQTNKQTNTQTNKQTNKQTRL